MERHQSLAVAYSTSHCQPGKGAALKRVLLFLACLQACALPAQECPPLSRTVTQIKQLFAQQKWQEIADLARSSQEHSPDIDYYEGIAHAQLGNMDAARGSLLDGRTLAPQDVRFPEELAGVEFKQKHYNRATKWLMRTLKLDPHDRYANDFLGTIYFLQGNLDAALKFWNRLDKPYVAAVQAAPELKIRPSLLDHAFGFSPEATLKLPDLMTSRNRIEGLGVFPAYSFHLNAKPDGKFDVAFHAQERDGFGSSKWSALLSTFRGAFYQTVYPEYFNIGGAAINVTSLIRWDSEKRRGAMEISAPLRQNPKWRYRFGADLRNENWVIRPSFAGPAPVQGALNLRRAVLRGDFESFPNGRFTWSSGGELSYRNYRNVSSGAALSRGLLLSGYQLKYVAHARYTILYLPEHKFDVAAEADSELARIWSMPSQTFEKLQGAVTIHWLPRPKNDDYELREHVSAGKTFGSSPFDELFMLGIERDNNLWLRGHVGTRDGDKGSAPLGKSYLLSNWDFYKNLYDNGLIAIKLGPLVDAGKIYDSNPGLATNEWMLDTGAQLKLRVLGVGLTMCYGKDLRTGNNAFYATTSR